MTEQSLGRRIGKLRGEVRRAAIQRVLDAWSESDLTRQAFSVEQRISPVSLGRWLREFETPAAEPALIEVGRTVATAAAPYEITCPRGYSLRVGSRFDSQQVSELLGVISRC